ncbi:energy transducer TonB [Aurantibacillus circumpalustris]|uniref:energy transducer TonB n=1 Tax=Aurantibacillus circumpalustris TaxID=3036359 RepID=UPI00295C00DB|nr:energy transducer TonB [Aurantibacillus circumpalustris]
MLKYILYSFFFVSTINAQLFSEQFEAQASGGKGQIEQVIETQLTLPKTILTSNFDVHVNALFDLDSSGHATNIKFKTGVNNALRNETKRILRFIRFTKTQNEAYETYPYSFSFPISTSRYNKFLKQRLRLNLKKGIQIDSSFIVYAKADRAPEYYKNGEEGMNDYILSEMEYPKLAIEKSVEGTVVIEFIVEANGYVTDLTIKQGLGAGCAEEALRILKLTRWQPAIINEKYVRYKVSYPITFSLRNVNRDASSSIGQ